MEVKMEITNEFSQKYSDFPKGSCIPLEDSKFANQTVNAVEEVNTVPAQALLLTKDNETEKNNTVPVKHEDWVEVDIQKYLFQTDDNPGH
ncbi:unnamed protein product [Enterobius vermicularis]|uniref:DUF104 domain-containing protein n=1 Tax=Enterobius vermicularis TaxID=51028 RepID=A0A0N4VBJ6_ENTVE|nr:unnamed protein product [Enterobius vermicularis]